jgi:uncharacterized protein
MRLQILDSYTQVDAGQWDALVGTEGSPFLEHCFLAGLEQFGCATRDTGWVPRPVLLFDGNRLAAAAPCWVKNHSMGEFVYDHGWADAAQRAGYDYYPKLVTAAPFTPATGTRLLGDPAHRDLLLRGILEAASDCRGAHVLFCQREEAEWLAERGLFPRTQFQFHWLNEGYQHFDDFLGRFRSKHRNKLRRERREASQFRIEAGTSPDASRIDALYSFYTDTCTNFGPWGRAYLSHDFFHYLRENWADRIHYVIAWDGRTPIAGTFNVMKGKRLYGRYWGSTAAMKFLHFELCYYQPIDWCIEHGFDVFEPGHGGGHKYKRGFTPTTTWSSHLLADPRLHDGLSRFTAGEREHVAQQVRELTEQSRLR